MADLRIVDAPLLSTVKGTEKLPTGGEGNFSVSIDQVADFAKLKWSLATEGYVDTAVGNVQADLNLHKNNESNPHNVTKTQVGLGNVDNTADLDKPVSNATQSAIITANSGKADKSYVDSQDQLKADKTTIEASLLLKADKVDLTASKITSDSNQTQQAINDFGGANWYNRSGGYDLGATVKLENGDIVKSTIDGNTNDPNVDMTGWSLPSASEIYTKNGDTQQEINDKSFEAEYLGNGGIKLIVGEENNAHYGWGGIISYPSGKLVFICRKAAGHGTLNTAALIAKDSLDGGQTWTDERVIISSTAHDLRPDAPRLMFNNRGGLIVNRASTTAGAFFNPLFLYSDDEGVTWQSTEIASNSPYTFSSTGGMLKFPSAVGGNDNTGFISFGFLSAGGFDALYTLDNGVTWLKQFNVAMPSAEIGALSEWGGCQLGDTNRWIFLLRTSLPNAGGWNPRLTAYFTTDPLNWGSAYSLDLGLGGNTPHVQFSSDKIHIMNMSRGGRPIESLPENGIATLSINADVAFNTKLSGISKYDGFIPMPHWATGYIASFNIGKRKFITLTCGEIGANGGGNSIQVMVGDFKQTALDTMDLVSAMTRQIKSATLLELTADSETASPLRIYSKDRAGYVLFRDEYLDHHSENGKPLEFNSNTAFKFSDPLLLGGAVADIEKIPIQVAVQGANNPSIKSSVASAQARNHITFHNTNGLVGTISTTASATTYATTSDETLKDFEGEYDAQKAIEIIKADPVRAYTWKQSGEKSFGWGAQTSYSIDKTLAAKGGWYLDDEEVEEGIEGAVYVPWGIDYSKRVPHLWAAVSYLLDEVERLKQLTEV